MLVKQYLFRFDADNIHKRLKVQMHFV